MAAAALEEILNRLLVPDNAVLQQVMPNNLLMMGGGVNISMIGLSSSPSR